jgi:hypothetical protein
MKTISSRKLEVKSQVGHSQIRNELIETSPTSHHNPCFGVANAEVLLRAQSSMSGSAARQTPRRRPWLFVAPCSYQRFAPPKSKSLAKRPATRTLPSRPHQLDPMAAVCCNRMHLFSSYLPQLNNEPFLLPGAVSILLHGTSTPRPFSFRPVLPVLHRINCALVVRAIGWRCVANQKK